MSRFPIKRPASLFDLALWALVSFSGIALMMYAYLGIFSRHLADDYCVVDFLNTPFPIALRENYLHVSDRFSNFILITLSEAISPHTVAILPALMLLLWLFGLAWLLRQAARFGAANWDSPLILALTFVLAFSALLQAPNRFQILYWRSSLAAHFAPLVFMPFLAAGILRALNRLPRQPIPLWLYPLLFLASFFVGGFSEPPVLIMISLWSLAFACTWLGCKGTLRRAVLSLIGASLLGAVLALLVMTFSPAHAFRLEDATPPTLPLLFTRAFGYGLDFIKNAFRTLPLPLLFTWLTPFLIFFMRNSSPAGLPAPVSARQLFALLFLVPLLSYLLIVASFLPSAYGQSFPVERARFAGQLCLVAGVMLLGALLGGLTARRLARLMDPAPLKLLAALLLLGVAFYPLRAVSHSFADLPAYRQRAAWWDIRQSQIFALIQQGQTDLIIKQFDGVEGVKELDTEAGHWVNRCAAKYYGVNSIRAFSKMEFP